MEGDLTISEVSYFLNEIDFSEKLDNDKLGKINKIKNNCKRI